MADVRILTREQIKDLRRAQRVLHDLVPLIEVAETCGQPCAEHRAKLEVMQEIITSYIRDMGPKGVT